MKCRCPLNGDMDFDPASRPWQSIYRIMIGAIAPRPIGWISSLDATGQPNLAPFSFFNAVCANPPHVLFCPMVRGRDARPKDTLRNVRGAGEFVANIVSEPLVHAMNITSTDFPPEVNEFEAAGLTPLPGVKVRPPRVAESAVQFECRLAHLVELGSGPGSGSVVIGEVVYVHIRDDVLAGEDEIRLEALRPIGRLGGHGYVRVTDVFELRRPRPPFAAGT